MRKAEEGAVLKAPSSLPIRRRQLQPPRLISSKNHFEGTVQGGLLPTDGPTTSKLRPRTWFGLQGSAQGAKAEDTGPTESVWTRHIGSRVRVGGAKTGILLFYGETQFAAGAWCGIRLDEPVGKNDGMVKGVRYFTCEPDHGIFAPPGKVTFEDGTAMEERCGDVTFNRYSFAGPGPELQTAMNVTIDYDSTKLVLGPGGPLSNTMPETGCPSPKKVDLDAEPGPSLQTDLNMTFDCASPSGACEPNATYNPYDIDVWTIGSAATIHHDLRPEIADDLTASGNLANPLGQGDTTFTFSTTVQQSSTAAASHPGQLQSLEASEQFRAVLGPMNATISLNGPNSGPMDLVQSPICESEFRPCGETDLDSTFTVGPMESTPVFARVEGGVQGPPLPLSESCYTIQEPVDEEESVGDEGAVVGRQWSMDLDESFGILTPNQMKDFTVAAEIAPAETPSDEGIQDLAEDEVADEIPNESAPFAVDSVRFIFNETFPNSSLYVTVVSSGRPTVPIPRPTELGDSFVEKPGCPVLNLPTGAPSVDQVSSRSSVAPIPEPAGWDSVISFTERIQQSTDLAPTKEKTVALEATHERDLVYSEVEYPNLAPSNVPPQSTPNYVQGTTVCTEPLQEVGVDVDDCTPVGSEPTDTVTSDLHNSPTPHSFSPGSLVDEVQTRTCVQDFAVPPPQDLEKHRRYCLERFSVHPEVDPTIVQYEPKDPEGQLHCHEVMTVRLTATEAEPVDDRRMDETADSSVVIDSASSGVGTDGLTKVDEGDRGNALESRKSLPDTEPEDVVQTDPLGERLTFPKKATKLLSNLRDLKEEKSKTPAISRVGPIYTEEMIRVLDDSKEGGTANVAAVISGHAGCLDAKFSEPFEGSLADGCGGEVSKAGAKVTDLLDITLGQSPKLPLPERVTIATCHHQLSEKPSYVGDGVPAADAAVEYLIQQMGGNFVQQVVEKREQTTTGMAVSVTSIDTGYQGDAECDLQSDAGTNAANTPVDDGQKEFRVPSVVGDQLGKHLRHGDAGSDSDFCSDMAASWTESDLEGEDRARGRGARIIDGRLYFGAGGGSGVSKDTEVTISSESLAEEGGVKFSPELKTENSAVEPELLSKPCVPEVSTSPPNAEETLQSPQRSVALAAVVPQQYRSSVVSVETVSTIDGSANYGSFVEEDETLLEPKEVSANVPSVPTDVSENITAGLVDGGGKKTLKTSESEQHRTDVSPRPSNKGKPRISDASPKPSSKGKPRTSTPSKKGTSPKTPKSKTPESAKANSDKKEPSSASSKKLKTPKKNVMSKIKAMIEATSNKLVNKDTSSGSLNTSAAKSEDDPKKASRLPKKNRWDAVMSKIAAGQAEEKGKTKKEVASKINSNLAPLKAKSPQAASAPTSGCDAKKKESSGFKTAAPFKVPKARTEVVNAVSSNKTPRSKSGAGAGSDTGDFSVRSRSENSASQPSGPSAQLPISAKTTRPSALPISLPRIGASRSPSVASTASGSSRGSTLSQLTLASLASTRPLQDVSVRSMGSNVSAPTDKSVNRSKLPPISTKKVPLPPATVQASARHSVAPTSASRVVHGTTHRTVTSIEGRQSGRQQQQHHPPPTLHSSRRPLRDSTAKISVDAGPAGRGSVALRSSNGSFPLVERMRSGRHATTYRRESGTWSEDDAGGNRAPLELEIQAMKWSGPVLHNQATHLRSLKNSQGLVKSGPHSDLPHSSVTRSATSREVTRLEALCEARTKELNFVRMQLKHCALGFDSLAILLQHLTQENAAFAVPELCCDLRRGKEKLQTARMELEEARTTQERLQDEIVSLQQRHQQQLERLEAEAQARLQDALETLRKDQEKEHESLMRCHDKEINNLMNKHIEEINILKITQNERINAIDREHSEASEQLQQQHLQEQTDLREIQRVEIEKLMALHEEEKAALGQQIEELNGRCTELEKQCMSLEDVLSHDSDYRIQIATNRCSSLEKEVESLKVVLEMRQSEIQDLRRSTQESRLQSEELATAREEIKKLMAKTEDLQAQMHTKVFSERQLLSDHERLKENFEKEAYMTKRLSMENEELKWRVRQAKEFSITLSPVGGASGDSSDHNGAPPCNMSMYFWDNEGLGASPNGSFSPLKASTAPRIGPSRSCCSPHASPRLSPSKTSHQYSSGSPVSGRPLSAPLSHDHLRHVSTSEDDIPFSGEGQQPVMRVKLRDKPRRPRAVRNSCPAATSKQSPNRPSLTSELDGSPSSEANAVVGIGQHSSDVMMSTPSESPLTRQPTVDHHNLQLVHTVSPCSSELDQRSLSPPVMQAVSGTLHYQNDTGDANDSDEKITDAKVFFGEVETERYAATFEDFSAVSEFSHTTQVISGQYEHFGLNEGCYGKCDVLAEQSQILFWSFPQDVQQPPQSPGDHRVPDQDDSTLMDKNPISIREALKSLLRDSMPNSEKCDVGHAESVESEMTDQVSFLDGATHDTAGLGTMDFESPVFPAIKGSTDEDLKVEDLNSHDELFEVENTVRESVTERLPSKLPLILKQSEINGRDRFVKEAASLEMSVDVTVSSATNQDSVPSGRFSVSVPQHFQCGDSRMEPNLPLTHASISNGSNLGALSDLKVANLDETVYPIKHRTKSEDASVLSLHQTCVGSVEPDENHLGETIDGILKDLVVFRDLNVGQSTAVSCGATEVVDSEEVIGKSSTADPCSEAAEIKVTSDTVSADALEDETSRTSSEPLDSFSIASSSLGAAPALEPQAWGSIENETAGPVENSLQGESLSPKKTTTLVITFRAHALQSVSSSRGSSPVPPYTVTSGTVSDGSSSSSGSSRSGDDTASSDSSPRASPIGPEQPLPNKALKLLETSLFGGTRSPRTSAGEAMVLDDFSAPAPLPVDPSHQLLKKALQDQLLHDGPPSRSGSSTAYCDSPIESCGHGPSLEDSPLPGLSKPDTPESTSQLVAPTTDSTNCDVSWSDDDLPSETEV